MEVHVVPVSWAERERTLRDVRHRVFVLEQGVPEDLEWDAEDPGAFHFMAVDSAGQMLGCARLTQAGQIGRMAVLAEHRGRGIGAALLDATIACAADNGHREVFLHAQTHAEEFYHHAGFLREGTEYQEAGIEHISMRRVLPIDFAPADERAAQSSSPSRPDTAGDGPMRPAPKRLLQPLSFEDEGSALAVLEDSLQEPARSISLLSPNLDSAVFDQASVAQALSDFARRGTGVHIRILIYSSRLIVARGHRLVDLARRLDSKISIRRVPTEYAKDERGFVTWDKQGYWLLPNAEEYKGLANADDPVMAARLQERFDHLWERSVTDPELRTLKL